MEAYRAPTGTTAGASGNGHGRGQLRAQARHNVRTGRVSGLGRQGRGQNSSSDLKCVRGREGADGGRGLPGARSKQLRHSVITYTRFVSCNIQWI
jgi:hypothetical protein